MIFIIKLILKKFRAYQYLQTHNIELAKILYVTFSNLLYTKTALNKLKAAFSKFYILL